MINNGLQIAKTAKNTEHPPTKRASRSLPGCQSSFMPLYTETRYKKFLSERKEQKWQSVVVSSLMQRTHSLWDSCVRSPDQTEKNFLRDAILHLREDLCIFVVQQKCQQIRKRMSHSSGRVCWEWGAYTEMRGQWRQRWCWGRRQLQQDRLCTWYRWWGHPCWPYSSEIRTYESVLPECEQCEMGVCLF